jgi:hypothetical protein
LESAESLEWGDNFCRRSDSFGRDYDKNHLPFCRFWFNVSAVSRQKMVFKMTDFSKKAVVVAEKRGVKIYQSNPSIPSATEIKRNRRAQIATDTKGLVVDTGTGEILGHGGAIAYEWEEVDKERFVKLYLAGLKQAAGLTKAGLGRVRAGL